ncbi:MAG TPA: TonB-dependent receptor plug domain-containing protein, partial [Puia sp.]|nr:TonB-dependent receptor plug domain-containing protein [Puia sp.]
MRSALSILFLLAGVFFSTTLFSQKHEGIIKGKVLSADGTPAVYVSVELRQLKKIVLTNEQGIFVLSHLPEFHDSLVISSVELQVYARMINLQKGQLLDLGAIHLNYNVKELQRVEITGRYDRSYKSNYSFLGTKTETATKDIPQSISTVTKELIHDKMDFTLKDVVTDVAGVNQYSGFDEYTIRGFRAENPRNINGLRGYNTTYTSNMLVNVERVEVIKGPAATLYGNSDPGGTINLVTKKPLNRNEAEINISAGSWDHFRTQADLTGPMNKNKTLLYRLNAGYDQSHSFRNQFFSKSYQLAPSFSFVPNDKIRINLDFSFSHVNSVL